MDKTEWLRCPVCRNKTRVQIRGDTELKNFPLYCPKCKQESLIEAKDLQVTVVNGIKTKMSIDWQSDKIEFNNYAISYTKSGRFLYKAKVNPI